MKNKVTKSRFLSWYISDSDDLKRMGRMAADSLEKSGTFKINVQQLFDSCVYIPASICVTPFDDYEYNPNDVELING